MSLTNFQTSINNRSIVYRPGTIGHVVPTNEGIFVTVLMDPEFNPDPWSSPILYFNQHASSNYEISAVDELLIPLLGVQQENSEVIDILKLQGKAVTVAVQVELDEDIETALNAVFAPKQIIEPDDRLLIQRALRYGDNNVEYLSEEHLARIVQFGGSLDLVRKLRKATRLTGDLLSKSILVPKNDQDGINAFKRSLTEKEIDNIAIDFESGFIEDSNKYPIKSALCHLPIRAIGGR